MYNDDKTLINWLLYSGESWTVSTLAIQKLGIEPALMLAIFSEVERATKDSEGWFYCSYEVITELTQVSKYKQDKAIEILEAEKIITSDKRRFKFTLN